MLETLFQHRDGYGYIFDYAQGTGDSTYDGNVFPGTNIKLNDEASSWLNLSGYRICIYDDSNYGGQGQLLSRNGGSGNMDDTDVGGTTRRPTDWSPSPAPAARRTDATALTRSW